MQPVAAGSDGRLFVFMECVFPNRCPAKDTSFGGMFCSGSLVVPTLCTGEFTPFCHSFTLLSSALHHVPTPNLASACQINGGETIKNRHSKDNTVRFSFVCFCRALRDRFVHTHAVQWKLDGFSSQLLSWVEVELVLLQATAN